MLRRKIKLAARTQTSEDPLDVIFNNVMTLNDQRKKDGLHPIYNLGVGQPHLGTHKNITDSISRLMSSANAIEAFPYVDLQGSKNTLTAIRKLYKEYYPKVAYSEHEVMITNGATQALHNALGALVDNKDKVLLVEPYFSAYPTMVNEMNGTIVKVGTAINGFRLTAQTLRNVLKEHPDAKVLILNYPNNPSGIDLVPEELQDLVKVLNDYPELYIIVDDAYRELCTLDLDVYIENVSRGLSTQAHYTMLDVYPALKDRCIMINSASKGFGLAGARIGIVGAHADIIKAMTIQQAKSTSSISTLTEAGLIAAVDFKLNHTKEFTNWIAYAQRTYQQNRKLVTTYLQLLGCHVIDGDHGLFVLASVNSAINQIIPDKMEIRISKNNKIQITDLHQKVGLIIRNDKDLASYLLHAVGVAVIPGSAFGLDEKLGYIRISCAKNYNELTLAMINLKQALLALPEFEMSNAKKPNAVSLFNSVAQKSSSCDTHIAAKPT